MCGICGIVDLTKQRRIDPCLVREMTRLIQHRGPDGDGFYDAPDVTLGMRRLSIIDVEGSDQPLYNEDRSLAMVFNGEIYNYSELRADLLKRGHTFHTEGDGETILHLYEEHGLGLFAYLRGMYALALWDSNAERLLLAVDHIGMKPLYLHERDGKLLFASEVKALFADDAMPRALNLDVLDTYLSFGYMIGEETLFGGVRRLMPGHVLVAENGTTRVQQYWQFERGYSHPNGKPDNGAAYQQMNEAQLIQATHDLLVESVRIHLRSDVPLGLFLSGGVDSAATLGLMAQEASGRIKTFTVGYATQTPDNELQQAKRVAAHFGTDHHARVITADDWWTGFQKYVYHHDEPNANSSATSLLLLAEEAARHVKVVLTGLGSDELFGGYPGHQVVAQMLRHEQVWKRWLSPVSDALGAVERYYPAFKRYRIIGAVPYYLPRLRYRLFPRDEGLRRMNTFDGMVLSDVLRSRLYGPDLVQAWHNARHKERTYSAIIAQSWCSDPYNTAQALLINTWLTGNALLNCDKVTMASSLEARVPFFDPVLLDFAVRTDPQVRMQSNKYLLRQAMRPYVPDFALNQAKKAFGTPIRGWFEHELSARIQAVLLDPGAVSRQVLNAETLEQLVLRHASGREKHEELILRLLNLELWHARFMRASQPV